MYKHVPFHISPMEQIEHDLIEAKELYGSVRRISLINADSFVLSASRLKAIAKEINEVFPEIETIIMYASIKNISGKTNEELR